MSDDALSRLQRAIEEPDLSGTRYELVERVGQGGMGVVYRVHDPELGRDVALKLVRTPELAADAVARLRREARTLARLEHPGIVPVHDAGTLGDGRPYYVMKLVQGERLDLRTARGLDLQTLLTIAERLCEAVAFAHARGVIHRDLKPQNVMVGDFGEVLVLDWGVAKVRDEAELPEPVPRASVPGDTQPGTVLGTPGWMAPEQAVGERVDARADVYAIGAILNDLVETWRRGTSGRPNTVPRPLRAIVEKARAVDAADRYPEAGAVAEELRAYRGGLPVRAHREGPLERLERIGRKYRTPIALVLAYVLMRALLILFGGG